MHKVSGKFSTKDFALVIQLSKSHQVASQLYKNIKNYYTYNMFIHIARQASRYRRLLICSVGDHLNRHDEQDPSKADLYIEVEVIEEPSKDLQDHLDKLDHWNITVELLSDNKVKEKINMSVRKTDGMIIRD